MSNEKGSGGTIFSGYTKSPNILMKLGEYITVTSYREKGWG